MPLSEVKNTPLTGVFFDANLERDDPEVWHAISSETNRQQDQIELIASENIVSPAVLQAQGSVMTNKYAEGYPGRRYYGGCEHYDVVEDLAIDRAKKLFQCNYANVQLHSGSQANQAVLLALLEPGDSFLGMALNAGGHLSHGAPVNISGKWFAASNYGVGTEDSLIDLEQVAEVAREQKPQIIIAGGSAYSRIIDFARFRAIADEIGAYFMVDMAHFAGLVAGKVYPSPFPHAHIVTTTTHKTLRGPRGGMILSNDEELSKKIDSAVFPGLQGGPLMHQIAAKAVALGEALEPGFREYALAVVNNARALASSLSKGGLDIVSGGTDTHLALVDLRPKGLTGREAEISLETAYLTCNKNAVPFDPEKASVTSGLRVGTPVGTTRGFGEDEFTNVGRMMVQVLDGLASNPGDNNATEMAIREEVISLCRRFPIYGNPGSAKI